MVMVMKNYSKLVSLAQNGLIRTKDVSAAGIARDYLQYAVTDGVIENIACGVYILKNELEDRMFIFQLKNSRLVFSAYTSAYLLGLTTRDSEVFSVSAPLNYNNPKLQHTYSITREKEDIYGLGLSEVNTAFGNPVKTHDAERTVCDLFNPKYAGDRFVQVEALKNYLQSVDKNLVKLFEYAKLLGIYNELKTRIEVLL
jgi:hypothetical protein